MSDKYITKRYHKSMFNPDPKTMREPLATLGEIANEYGVPRATAYYWREQKGIALKYKEAIRRGKTLRYYPLYKLRKWMQERILESGKTYAKKV